ncbi:NAD-dependent epimerase/dehydratase family protein [Halobacillus fulvus]|nr:NAD-dependent epimerase/dehydratase family protein [Halobacillus fulvus]
MKIAVFGATGRVGTQFVRLALKEGHQVRALIRTPEKADHIKGAEWVQGDAKDPESIEKALEGCDLVFSGLSTDKTDTLSVAVPLIIEEMERQNLKRIVTIGTAGILNSRYEDGKFRFETSESKRKLTFAAEQHRNVFEAFSHSNLEWTIVCPTYLPDGVEQGNVRFEKDYLPEDGKKVTVGDTARFAYDELWKGEFIGSRVGICY